MSLKIRRVRHRPWTIYSTFITICTSTIVAAPPPPVSTHLIQRITLPNTWLALGLAHEGTCTNDNLVVSFACAGGTLTVYDMLDGWLPAVQLPSLVTSTGPRVDAYSACAQNIRIYMSSAETLNQTGFSPVQIWRA